MIDAPTPCKDDPDLFYPRSDTPAAHAAAKQLCRPCPYRETCLDWAIAHDERFGVWGGTDPTDRRRLTTAGASQEAIA